MKQIVEIVGADISFNYTCVSFLSPAAREGLKKPRLSPG